MRPSSLNAAEPRRQRALLDRTEGSLAARRSEAVLARRRPHGAELVGKVAQYEDSYRLCYARGRADIIVALAEPLS